jgi:hypothetical protein
MPTSSHCRRKAIDKGPGTLLHDSSNSTCFCMIENWLYKPSMVSPIWHDWQSIVCEHIYTKARNLRIGVFLTLQS